MTNMASTRVTNMPWRQCHRDKRDSQGDLVCPLSGCQVAHHVVHPYYMPQSLNRHHGPLMRHPDITDWLTQHGFSQCELCAFAFPTPQKLAKHRQWSCDNISNEPTSSSRAVDALLELRTASQPISDVLLIRRLIAL
jgi:hypothetical protein